jgi:hypothetical protein
VLKSEKGSRLGFINIFVFSVKLNLISKINSARNRLVYAGIPYQNSFLFLIFIPAHHYIPQWLMGAHHKILPCGKRVQRGHKTICGHKKWESYM